MKAKEPALKNRAVSPTDTSVAGGINMLRDAADGVTSMICATTLVLVATSVGQVRIWFAERAMAR
jgi:hypothetical protein